MSKAKKTGNTGFHTVTGGGTQGVSGRGFSYSISNRDDKWIHFQISINTDDHKRFSKKEILGTLRGIGENFCNKHI